MALPSLTVHEVPTLQPPAFCPWLLQVSHASAQPNIFIHTYPRQVTHSLVSGGRHAILCDAISGITSNFAPPPCKKVTRAPPSSDEPLLQHRPPITRIWSLQKRGIMVCIRNLLFCILGPLSLKRKRYWSRRSSSCFLLHECMSL